MSKLVMENIGKVYRGGVEAVKNLNIEINDGEFMCLLGPSGCGKSTVMRMIAGLEEITSGKMYVDDICVNSHTPKERDVAMAFENYALYPNMTIGQNISFPLEIRKVEKQLIEKKVHEVSSLLGIEGMLDEPIKGLSGGVQQRVGVARALVRNPKILLLDEPISHLEEELKAKMREELRKIQRRLGVTTIYVTHDQIEAMVMADRIAIMNFGVLQQIDKPEVIYSHPNNIFVGGFIGEPPMNFVECELKKVTTNKENEGNYFVFNDVFLPCPKELFNRISNKKNKELVIGVRDTQIIISKEEKENYVVGKVFFIEPRGEEQIISIEIGGKYLLATSTHDMNLSIEDPVWITFDFDLCNFFDKKSGKNIFIGD